MRIWKIPDQVIRLAFIFVLAIAALIAVRARFVPDSFGVEGHYRAEAVPSILALETRYAGAVVCHECHDDIGAVKEASYHRGVACEACHGAAAAHADEPDEHLPLVPRSRQACLACHDYLFSRPTGFPQVFDALHNATKPCTTCHDPHDPTPPEVPSTCGACHASLARMKSVSHHASLECETCHEADSRHRENPRAHLPKKPDNRAFCGQCHGKDADAPRTIPRVALESHGGRYVCWQCHYPHYPER